LRGVPAPLDCFSEPYPPHGALAAEGAENLLGRPRLDPLTVLVREAVQNSWDARRGGPGPVRFDIRAAGLSTSQRSVLGDEVFAHAPAAAARLRSVLGRGDVALLSLTDGGTTGLAGPIRADRPAPAGAPTNFVDLVFNIGQPTDRRFGGGSYGFGKTISFVVSEARAVVIHTRTAAEGEPSSRLIAAAFSDHFAQGSQRFTGRHWWGRRRDGSIEPVLGDEADELARAIGLVPFAADETGTTIAIVAPDFRGRSPIQAMRFVADAITWNCWPKMVASPAAGPAMVFGVEVDGEVVDVCEPDQLPPLAPYADALRAVRDAERAGTRRSASTTTASEPADGPVVIDVTSASPPRRLGRLAMARVPVSPRVGRDVGIDDALGLGEPASFDGLSHHVALLRQPELVVDYFEGPELPLLDTEWAGVFKADADLDDVFAAAEPPTHDGWEPSLVDAGPARRWVLSALLELRDAAAAFAVPHADAADDGRRSAVLVAEALGGLLEHEPSDELLIPPEPPAAVTFSAIAMAEAPGGRRRSEVAFTVESAVASTGTNGATTRVLDGRVDVVAGPDGRATAPGDDHRGAATFVGFVDGDERWTVTGPALAVARDAPKRWWVQVESPLDAAVAVELESRPAGERRIRLVVQPHWSAASVRAAPWRIGVHGVSHPAGGRLHGWDYETALEVTTTVRIDPDEVRRECGLGPDDGLALVGSWLATSTNTRRRGAMVAVTAAGDHRLQFAVDPGDAGGRLRVERRLVLTGRGTGTDPFGARDAGSVLWFDEPVVTLLEVDVARFPTEAVDFERPPVDLPGAAWWLEARFDDLDAAPHHAVRLYVNAEHPALEPVLSGSTEVVADTVRSVLRWEVTRSLLVGALESDEYVARAAAGGGGFEPGTLGSSLRRLQRRHFPDRGAGSLQRQLRDDPRRFDAQLQAAVDLWGAGA
jgi:hypothetical protein